MDRCLAGKSSLDNLQPGWRPRQLVTGSAQTGDHLSVTDTQSLKRSLYRDCWSQLQLAIAVNCNAARKSLVFTQHTSAYAAKQNLSALCFAAQADVRGVKT